MTHYIPLNGFHPLYRAVFDEKDDELALNALDNIKLFNALQYNENLVSTLRKRNRSIESKIVRIRQTRVGRRYVDYFDTTNLLLTDLLPGQIEFHHTAPFPSGRRPFVFHCESFLPVFYPFAHQGTDPLPHVNSVREHYRKIFSSKQCLGIFSHVPETLSSLSRFFGDSIVDDKLQLSRIGISRHSLQSGTKKNTPVLANPNFLFINSAHQNPENFFLRGGHIVLRFWKELLRLGVNGRVYIRCGRPEDSDLLRNGVDIEFLKKETGQSVVWIENYLSNKEMNALMCNVHFMLLPSVSLHSLSIMQAMALGTVPVVTDTVGTSVYVEDDDNGIVLRGVRERRWFTDPETGIEYDRYAPDAVLDESLVTQLTKRVVALLNVPEAYEKMRLRALERATKEFSGDQFSCKFWGRVADLYERNENGEDRPAHTEKPTYPSALNDILVADSQWARLFESPTQPNCTLYTGLGRVSEFGGAFVAHRGPILDVHDWSPVRAYVHPGAPELVYSATIKGLHGRFLDARGSARGYLWLLNLIQVAKRVLKPYPKVYRVASRVFKMTVRNKRILFAKYHKEHAGAPQLVLEDFFGYNIIQYNHRFYAILQSEGVFEYEKIRTKGYSSFFTGLSIAQVRDRIVKSRSLV